MFFGGDHPTGEVAVTGNEGLFGVSIFLEGTTAPGPQRYAVVQRSGEAYRLRAEILRKEFSASAELRQQLLRYTRALITQIAQTGACNRHHRVSEQLCRWLLLRLDRSPDCELSITHEQITYLLGVRREGITETMNELRSAGIIRSRRSLIVAVDRLGLERKVCECYHSIRNEYGRLLS